jgi:S-DNA-T family DNA segregation ATPase FtsK/SpoIIIE
LAKKTTSKRNRRKSTRSKRTKQGASSGVAGRIAGGLSSFLSPQRKTELVGLLLLATGLFTVITVFSTRQGLLGSAWLNFLGWLFGWGLYFIPLALIAVGLRLLLRHVSDRIPSLESEQLFGLGLLYLLLLTLMHLPTGALTFDEAMRVAGNNQGGGG